MIDLRTELFNFRKKLNIDQQDIETIVNEHFNAVGNYSDKTIIKSLNEKLTPFSYDDNVQDLLDTINTALGDNSLLYDLKDLYHIIETKNDGMLYRQPLAVILDIINTPEDADKMTKILNNLVIYREWIPEVKMFISKILDNPIQRNDVMSGGECSNVYTIVKQVENGYLALIRDAWFIITENTVEKALLEDYVKEESEYKSLRIMQQMMSIAEIEEDKISFRISEDLTVGFSMADKKGVYINGENFTEDGENTLATIFNSTVVPLVNKQYYMLLDVVQKNLDLFVELDIVKRVTNIIKPNIEIYAFNYKEKVYAYIVDGNPQYGGMVTDFYQYEKAADLVNDVKNELSYDLTYFYSNKLEKESVMKKELEDKERQITLKLETLRLNEEKLVASIQTLGDMPQLNEALDTIREKIEKVKENLDAVKQLQAKNISRM